MQTGTDENGALEPWAFLIGVNRYRLEYLESYMILIYGKLKTASDFIHIYIWCLSHACDKQYISATRVTHKYKYYFEFEKKITNVAHQAQTVYIYGQTSLFLIRTLHFCPLFGSTRYIGNMWYMRPILHQLYLCPFVGLCTNQPSLFLSLSLTIYIYILHI